jgi:hypothetical protein
MIDTFRYNKKESTAHILLKQKWLLLKFIVNNRIRI